MDVASNNSVEDNVANICKICHDVFAKYCCPKCNIPYCSLNCYRANIHLQCSEYFYKDNILEDISLNSSDDEKKKMLELLQKTYANDRLSNTFNNAIDENSNLGDLEKLDSDDDDSYEDIAERLSGVNLDDADEVWDRLTEDERQEFVAFLRSEDVTKLIPMWQPWWLFYKEVTDKDITNSESFLKNCPTICDIKDITQITTKPPSECVKYNLINIITAYVFTARYFNGEHSDFVEEAVSCITSLSLALKVAQNFVDFETAVKSVEQECINSSWIVTDKDNFETMRDDLHKILRGPSKCENTFYLICALCDVRNLLTQSLKPSQGNKTSNFSKKFSKEQLPSTKLETTDIKKWRRKLDYYLSYTKFCYNGEV
ncbi:zinc finger HIT domain-containing protein 2 [Anoplophora glabripennis]|uniref:zinc finger HIT domain-containing protein 2 n=1 Tax=Anoplophora glabripennis TaxID=217634 RepID=UPI00087380F3|nr:zinc finger HIT domain-containing protein 2 [Anoplophora glabripennis]